MVAYPQANGQTKMSNRTLVNGIKKRIGKANDSWVEELPGVLWLHRTTPRTSTKETLFSMTYDTEVMLPAELMIRSPRTIHFPKKKER